MTSFATLPAKQRESILTDLAVRLNVSSGSLIRVDGFDDQERVDKILGTEYLHIFFNEATQISWSTVGTVLSATPGACTSEAN